MNNNWEGPPRNMTKYQQLHDCPECGRTDPQCGFNLGIVDGEYAGLCWDCYKRKKQEGTERPYLIREKCPECGKIDPEWGFEPSNIDGKYAGLCRQCYLKKRKEIYSKKG